MLEPIQYPHDAIDDVLTSCLIRPWSHRDAGSVSMLAIRGLLAHQSTPTFPLRQPWLYLQNEREHFWVAEMDQRVIGTVALAELDRDVAQVQWLRVAPPWQPPMRLIPRPVAAAINHAREFDFLKVQLEVPLTAQARAIEHLHTLGFEFSRNRIVNGRNRAEFYANLYDRNVPRSA